MENKNTLQNIPEKNQEDLYNLRAPDFLPDRKPVRWSSLDIARGVAIFLMILSHTVKGVMNPYRIPDWGIIPVHLVTKFSSSLFILVFGVSLSLFFIPHIGKKSWRKKRFWMIRRGIELMFWYKALTVVQMFQFYPRSMIIDTLMFRRMPDFVEILCFYSIALIWFPFFLPLWKRMGVILKLIMISGTFWSGQWLHYNFDFWNHDILKALLVEHEDFYTFGQLQRGAVVFLGLFIGDLYKDYRDQKLSLNIPVTCILVGLGGFLTFYLHNPGKYRVELENIADNIGKHPFSMNFFLFSLGGALVILGLSLLMNQRMQKLMLPLSALGRHSLNAFNLHIIIIFYFYRYYFDLHHNVTYQQSLMLTGLCAVIIIVLMYLWTKTKELFK